MTHGSPLISHPRVFLHGWGLSSVVWADSIARLSADYPCLVCDLPGYGTSPMISPYNVDTLADTLAATLTHPVDLIAWSMGGMVALALAARHPDKVARLVLVATTPVFAARADWPVGMALPVLEAFSRSLVEDADVTLLRFLALQARGGEAAREVIAQLRERLRTQAAATPEVLAAGLELLRTVDLRDRVERVGCPTLLVHGAHDLVCAPEAGRWLAGQLPNARLAVHERAAHAPFLSHPDWFEATLKDFLHG